MRMIMRFFILSGILTAISACTIWENLQPSWVESQSEVQVVELRNETDVADCKLLDTITVKFTDRWVPSRNDKKARTEVLGLARNKARRVGGNVLVEKTSLVMGRQTFTVYSCP